MAELCYCHLGNLAIEEKIGESGGTPRAQRVESVCMRCQRNGDEKCRARGNKAAECGVAFILAPLNKDNIWFVI